MGVFIYEVGVCFCVVFNLFKGVGIKGKRGGIKL